MPFSRANWIPLSAARTASARAGSSSRSATEHEREHDMAWRCTAKYRRDTRKHNTLCYRGTLTESLGNQSNHHFHHITGSAPAFVARPRESFPTLRRGLVFCMALPLSGRNCVGGATLPTWYRAITALDDLTFMKCLRHSRCSTGGRRLACTWNRRPGTGARSTYLGSHRAGGW